VSDLKVESAQEDSRTFERRYDLDWLRIIGILLVFIFHCARFFDQLWWQVKNNWHLAVPLDQQSEGMTAFIYYLGGAGMPIFFIIAGMGTFYALRHVKGGLYALNRVVRLLVPFVIGLFTHIPIQVYLDRVSKGYFTGSFFEFYRQMFNGVYPYWGDFDIYGLHLWFLLILLIISLITLAGTTYYSNNKNLDRLDKFTNFLNKPGMLFVFPLPIMLFEFLFGFLRSLNGTADRVVGYFVLGGWSVMTHLTFFVYGYLFASNLKFKRTIEKHAIPALIIALACGIVLFFLDNFNIDSFVRDILFLIIATYYAWCVLICLFAMASRFLNRNNKTRKFMNELVMPFYVIHQTIIVVLGFYIVQLDMHFFAKYIIIILTSFTACVILLLPIKYINPLRFIFGMRWKRDLLRRTKEKEVIEVDPKIEDTNTTND
jgi:peptidoglycan/LPS O-acetylase OafA/YrhL